MGEFLAGVLIFGGVWFWIISAAIFIAVMALSENDSPFWALFVLIGFVALLNFAGTTDVWAAIKESPWLILKWALLYFVAGTIWSIVKWTLFARSKAERYRGLREKFMAKFELTGSIPDHMQHELHDFMSKHCYRSSIGKFEGGDANKIVKFDPRPYASNYKSKFTHWIVWWPTSVVWTLFDDFFVKVAEVIRDMFQGVYSRITNFMYRDLVD